MPLQGREAVSVRQDHTDRTRGGAGLHLGVTRAALAPAVRVRLVPAAAFGAARAVSSGHGSPCPALPCPADFHKGQQ